MLLALFAQDEIKLQTGPTPGMCRSCEKPLYSEYGVRALLSREITLSKCANDDHYYHQSCAESMRQCECGAQLDDIRVELKGFLDIPAIEQYSRLDTFYEGLLPQVEEVDVHDADLHFFYAKDPRRHAGRFDPPHIAVSPLQTVRAGDPRRFGRRYGQPMHISREDDF